MKKHSSSSKSLKEMYESRSDLESKKGEIWMHKRHSCHCRVQDSGTDSNFSADRNEKSRSCQNKALPCIRRLNDRIQEALDCRTYRLVDKASHFDDEVTRNVAKFAKRLQAQKESQLLNQFYPILIVSFLSLQASV